MHPARYTPLRRYRENGRSVTSDSKFPLSNILQKWTQTKGRTLEQRQQLGLRAPTPAEIHSSVESAGGSTDCSSEVPAAQRGGQPRPAPPWLLPVRTLQMGGEGEGWREQRDPSEKRRAGDAGQEQAGLPPNPGANEELTNSPRNWLTERANCQANRALLAFWHSDAWCSLGCRRFSSLLLVSSLGPSGSEERWLWLLRTSLITFYFLNHAQKTIKYSSKV